MRDVMFALQRFGDRREVERFNNAAPVGYDSYWNYADAVGASNNPLGAFNDCAMDESYQGRGVSRILSITGNTPGPGAKNITLVFETIEPLLLSPLIFMDPKYNNQGFYGIQVLNIIANVGATNRIFRSAQKTIGGAATNLSVSLLTPNAFDTPQLFIQYYTRQPSDLVSARNCVPFAEYPRYLSPIGSEFKAATKNATTGVITPAKLTSINSQSISLNSIPDKLIICVRKQVSKQTVYDSDHFFPISNNRAVTHMIGIDGINFFQCRASLFKLQLILPCFGKGSNSFNREGFANIQ